MGQHWKGVLLCGAHINSQYVVRGSADIIELYVYLCEMQMCCCKVCHRYAVMLPSLPRR